MRARVVAAVLAGALGAGVVLQAGRCHAAELPPDLQALLLSKVLAYDQNAPARTPRAATVVILYVPGRMASDAMREALSASLSALARTTRVGALPLRVVELPYTDAQRLDVQLGALQATAVYVCPDLEGAVPAIGMVARRRQVLSLCGSEELTRRGLSIALVAADNRPALVVNVAASRAEGAKLDAALLRIAHIVNG